MQIIRKAKKKRTVKPAWSADQQKRYKELVIELESRGLSVRREELKRGHCWRAQSGMCRSLAERIVFVDSRMSADDQVAFLASQVVDVKSAAEAVDPSKIVFFSPAVAIEPPVAPR